jgi:predicted enzyme related to lactoylglutathione lyase
MQSTFSNLTIVVSNLPRSITFYCEALGFTASKPPFHAGEAVEMLMEIPGVEIEGQFVGMGHLEIELVSFVAPGVEGTPGERPLNVLRGMHLTFQVGDIEATARRIVEFGGSVHESTRTRLEFEDSSVGEYLYCFDPDGVRIELIRNSIRSPDQTEEVGVG